MKWLDLLRLPEMLTHHPDPTDEVVELRPGTNVFSGRKLVLKLRVWRESEQRWHDVPDEVSNLDGAPLK